MTDRFFDFGDQLAGLYDDILSVAKRELKLRENPGHSWRPSDLTNEAICNLIAAQGRIPDFDTENEIIAYVTVTMKNLLINRGIRNRRQKRGGGRAKLPSEVLDEIPCLEGAEDEKRYLEIEKIAAKLGESDPRAERIFRLHWYSGKSSSDLAETFGLSPRTIQLELKFAMSWIKREFEKHNS